MYIIESQEKLMEKNAKSEGKGDKKPKEANIKELVEVNYKLLSAIGIFGAISAYFSTVKFFDGYMAFFPLGIFLLLSWEFYNCILEEKREKKGFKLEIFEFLFMGFIFTVTIYIFFSFKQVIMVPLLVGLIFLCWISLVSKAMDRLNLFYTINNFTDKHKNWGFLIKLMVFLMVLALIYCLAYSTCKLMTFFGLKLCLIL